MIDLHCHILPGLDDGPAGLKEALAMCRLAVADGITTIVATPHYKPGSCDWSPFQLFSAVSTLQDAVNASGLTLTILSGAEIAVFPELPVLLRRSRFLSINNGRYFLVEFCPYGVPANAEQFLGSLLDCGLVPIIAHPERCALFVGQPDLLARLADRGALLQLTAGSITGSFGPQARDFSLRLMEKGLAHIIASDAHDIDERPPSLAAAVALAAALVGSDRARAMVTAAPAAVVESRSLFLTPPVEIAEQAIIRPHSWFRRLLGAAV